MINEVILDWEQTADSTENQRVEGFATAQKELEQILDSLVNQVGADVRVSGSTLEVDFDEALDLLLNVAPKKVAVQEHALPIEEIILFGDEEEVAVF